MTSITKMIMSKIFSKKENQKYPSLDYIQHEIERTIDLQSKKIDSFDTRSGVLIGFSGILVSVIVRTGTELTLWLAISGILALIAALFAGVSIYPRAANAINPQELLETYAQAPEEDTKFETISTLIALYEEEEYRVKNKVKYIHRSTFLLLSAVLIMLTGSVVDSTVPCDITRWIGDFRG